MLLSFHGKFLDERKKFKVYVSFCIPFILGFEKEEIIHVSSSCLRSLSFLSFSSSVPKNENTKGWMANVYREEEMYSLQVFEFFQLHSSK